MLKVKCFSYILTLVKGGFSVRLTGWLADVLASSLCQSEGGRIFYYTVYKRDVYIYNIVLSHIYGERIPERI